MVLKIGTLLEMFLL